MWILTHELLANFCKSAFILESLPLLAKFGRILQKIVNLLLFSKVYDNAHSYRVMIKDHADISIEPP